jgi:flagellar protein FliS
MQTNYALDAYRKVGVESAVNEASPYELISMLMEGFLDRVASAKGAMVRNEAAKQGELIGKAISIIDTMRVSLDHETGGDLATKLSDLYEYMENRLLQARLSSDVGMLDEVSALMREIKSGWDAIPAEHRSPK